MKFSVKTYKRLKSIIHPNIRKKIERFRIEDYYVFPTYHGCNFKNRCVTNKRINYAVGEMCVTPTENLCWKDESKIKWKYLPQKIYFTRYGLKYGMNNFAKNKGRKWYDWDKKQYFNRDEWIKKEQKEFKNSYLS